MERKPPMSRSKLKFVAAFAVAATLAAAGTSATARTYRSYGAGCAHWLGSPGHGMRCFDCLRPVIVNGVRRWANTCGS
jgi:hypothetical protein